MVSVLARNYFENQVWEKDSVLAVDSVLALGYCVSPREPSAVRPGVGQLSAYLPPRHISRISTIIIIIIYGNFFLIIISDKSMKTLTSDGSLYVYE